MNNSKLNLLGTFCYMHFKMFQRFKQYISHKYNCITININNSSTEELNQAPAFSSTGKKPMNSFLQPSTSNCFHPDTHTPQLVLYTHCPSAFNRFTLKQYIPSLAYLFYSLNFCLIITTSLHVCKRNGNSTFKLGQHSHEKGNHLLLACTALILTKDHLKWEKNFFFF